MFMKKEVKFLVIGKVIDKKLLKFFEKVFMLVLVLVFELVLELEFELEFEFVKEEKFLFEFILVDIVFLSLMEIFGCVFVEEDLCQVFFDVIFVVNDVDVEDGVDLNFCSEYVKDIYVYLR